MVFYVVHGNSYYDGYGSIEKLFGIFTEKDSAESAKDLIVKELFKKEMSENSRRTIINDISDIEVEILEIEANKITDIELGGYCE